jgi:hypothetical protein
MFSDFRPARTPVFVCVILLVLLQVKMHKLVSRS